MKILILNHYATSPDSIGISRHIDLSKYLVKNHNVQVEIVASSFNHQTRKEEHIIDNRKLIKNNYFGVDFIWLKTTKYSKNDYKRVLNILSYTVKAYSYLKLLKKEQRPDIIIGSLMHPLAAILGMYYSKKWKVKFVFEERDLWPQSLIDLGKVKKDNFIVKVLDKVETVLYNSSYRIIFLFDKAYLYAKEKGVSSNKIVYLPNGVDLNRLDENKKIKLDDKINKFFEEKTDKIIGIYSGAHSIANDLDDLVNAIRFVDDRYHFIFIGDGPEKKRIISYCKKNNIKNITFFEAINKNSLQKLLTLCDFGIIKFKDLPVYRWGVSPNKIYDYMGASLPIIMGLNDDDHIIQKNCAGKIINKNFGENLSKVLSELNKDDFVLMGENARKLAEQNFSWEILAEILYDELSIED
ncbi:glycosyltransferase WbuB [Macrococcoides canis]|uniref:glycosyltransferase family 4 protein n=1 Tax=Macrococcoides canis TaxID=1855823 RepID=UPI00105C7C6C|nr:glycosyltransferase family 4 protein [Macrococcus canis]TDM32449.1 glycosyltransferase WbuB [Macrococcus canis]